MLNLLGLLIFCFPSDSVSGQQFYYYKDSVTAEIISINNKGFYECYRKSTLPHTFPFYCQGRYENVDNIYILHPGIVDSLLLTVKERKAETVNNEYFFVNTVKIVGDKNNLRELYYFNYDHLNKVSYDMDIKLCIEDVNGVKYYKRLDKDGIDFKEVITEGQPVAFYLMVGSYILTHKYYIKSPQSNEFDISVNKNDLFSLFKDFYLANHRFKKSQEYMEDLMTGRIYKSLKLKGSPTRIDKIAGF